MCLFRLVHWTNQQFHYLFKMVKVFIDGEFFGQVVPNCWITCTHADWHKNDHKYKTLDIGQLSWEIDCMELGSENEMFRIFQLLGF